MEQRKKLLSIVIPIYNGEKFLRELMESIVGELSPINEVILVNDGSTDKTEIICKEYEKRYSNVIYIKKDNSGVCDTRNLGIKKATGKYVGFADADDWFEKGSIQYMTELAEKSNEDMILYEFYIVHGGKKQKFSLPVQEKVWADEELFEQVTLPMMFGYRNTKESGFNLGVWNTMIKKDFIKKNSLAMDPYLRMGEDIVYLSQALCCAKTVKIVKKPLYCWRSNTQSVTHTYTKTTDLAITKVKYITRKMEEALKSYPIRKWEQFIHPRYGQIIISSVKNWTNKNSGDSVITIYRKTKRLYTDSEITSHITMIDLTKLHGRQKLEFELVKQKRIITMMLYGYLYNSAKSIKYKLLMGRKG